MTTTYTMPAGEYYVGDLCYVIGDRWNEFCILTINGRECLDGVFTLADGTKFATFGTAYGDGLYNDQLGGSYPVDAGLIGCVMVSDIKDDEAYEAYKESFVTFDEEFEVCEEDGVIYIGNLVIDTNGEEEYHEEEYLKEEYHEEDDEDY